MVNLIFTFIVGAISGYAFHRMKVPGGMLIGAIFGSALLNISLSAAYMPEYGKYAAQITAGAFIGTNISRDDFKEIRSILFPMATLLMFMLLCNISIGFLIWRVVGGMDLTTALMGCVPGGLSDVPIIAADMGADIHKVAIMQFFRAVAGIGLFPMLIAAVTLSANREQSVSATDKPAKKDRTQILKETKDFGATMAVAACGGILGKALGIPGGMLVFAMLAVGGLKLLTGKAHMPLWAKHTARILVGAYIGSSMSFQDLIGLYQLLIPILLIFVGYFLNCVTVGYILHKKFGFSKAEAMLAATPAGASDMALISGDLGVKSTRLIVMQVIRLIAVVAIFPQVIHFIVGFF